MVKGLSEDIGLEFNFIPLQSILIRLAHSTHFFSLFPKDSLFKSIFKEKSPIWT